MKYLILIVLGIGFLLTSCGTDPAVKGKANIDIVKKYVEAVQEADIETMGSLLADDYLGLGPSIADSINKEDALANWEEFSSDLFESLTYHKEYYVAMKVNEGPKSMRGDWVTNWSNLTIEYKNGLGPVELYVNVVYKIEDGKIARTRTFYNEGDAMRQLGYYITPPLIDIE